MKKISGALVVILFGSIWIYNSLKNESLSLSDQSEDTVLSRKKVLRTNVKPSLVTKVSSGKVGKVPKEINEIKKRIDSSEFHSIQSPDEAKKVKNELSTLFKLPLSEIKTKISLIKIKQDQIKEWKFNADEALTVLELMKPEYAITMSLVLKKPVGEIVSGDQASFNLGLSDIYVIQTFSESKDFNILISQNRLNSKVITLKRLKEIYSNDLEKTYFEDDRVEGVPSTVQPPIDEGTVDDVD